MNHHDAITDSSSPTRFKACAAALLLALACSGCTVLTVAGAAVGIASTVVSTSVDVAVGTAKVGAKVGGAVIDAAIPDKEENK
jgi:hypothetical protein